MALTKAEQEARDRHEAYEKEREKAGIEVHLPRAEEADKSQSSEKKKPGGK